MSISYKCPNCGADLLFNADQQTMTCDHCSCQLSPTDFTDQTSLDSTTDVPLENTEAETPLWSEDAVSYLCDSCGAEVITDQNTVATFCAFCGSTAIIKERLICRRRPSVIIPFKYGKDVAAKKFLTWCHNGRIAPYKFASEGTINKITGLYVPFWLFDSAANMTVFGKGCKVVEQKTDEERIITKNHYKILRKRDVAWNKIPLDGSQKIDDGLVAAIEPYIYKDLQEFNMVYLAGFYADQYDVGAEELTPQIEQQIKDYVRQIFDESVEGYESVSHVNDLSHYHPIKSTYALLPVWIMNYKYQDETYTFLMNGQTGKVAGTPPISRMKVTLFKIIALLITLSVSLGLAYFINTVLLDPKDTTPQTMQQVAIWDPDEYLNDQETGKILTAALALVQKGDINIIIGVEGYIDDSEYHWITGGAKINDHSGIFIKAVTGNRHSYISSYGRMTKVMSEKKLKEQEEYISRIQEGNRHATVTMEILKLADEEIQNNILKQNIISISLRILAGIILPIGIAVLLLYYSRKLLRRILDSYINPVEISTNLYTYVDDFSFYNQGDKDEYSYCTIRRLRRADIKDILARYPCKISLTVDWEPR